MPICNIGTDEERGLLKWRESVTGENLSKSQTDQKNGISEVTLPLKEEGGFGLITDSSVYDLPLITDCLKRQSWANYIPFLPSYQSRANTSPKGKRTCLCC